MKDFSFKKNALTFVEINFKLVFCNLYIVCSLYWHTLYSLVAVAKYRTRSSLKEDCALGLGLRVQSCVGSVQRLFARIRESRRPGGREQGGDLGTHLVFPFLPDVPVWPLNWWFFWTDTCRGVLLAWGCHTPRWLECLCQISAFTTVQLCQASALGNVLKRLRPRPRTVEAAMCILLLCF